MASTPTDMGPAPLPAKVLKPKISLGPTESPGSADIAARAIRSQTAVRSHNVFRPDVYRVSEGYLN
jgi:hypothetical protein